MKLNQYANKWLETIGAMKKPATIASMRSHVQKMDSFLIGTELEDLTEELAQIYVVHLFSKLSPQAVRCYWGTTKLILTRAKKEGLIDFIPEPCLPKGGQKPQLYFDLEQLKSLSRCEVLYFLLAESGLRIGEALGLKNSDIDFKNQTLTVNRSVYAAKEQAPKTSNAFRTISISGRLCHALAKADGEYLFPTRNGGAQYQTNMLRKLHADLEELKIPITGFHAFRRGNATLSAEIGVPIKAISQRHGRSTGDLTVDFYVCSKLNDREYAEKLGEILSR